MLNDKETLLRELVSFNGLCDDVTRQLTCDVYNRKDVSQSTFQA